MDVNQTRFHLVYGKDDWYRGATGSPPGEPLFDWNADQAALSLHQELFVFPKRSGQLPLDVAGRRGAARDRYGNWYWIESDNELRFLGTTPGAAAEHFWSAGDEVRACPAKGEFFSASSPQPETLKFSGLAVTRDHYLAVGLREAKGLLIFDLYSGGPPARLLWPAGVLFAPFDMAVASDGGVVVLDRDNKSYWKLDHDFRVQGLHMGPAPAGKPDAFQPAAGTANFQPPSCVTSQLTGDFAVSLASLSDPVAIEGLPDGSVLILDNPSGAPYSVIHRFRDGVQLGAPVALDQALAGYVPDPPSPENPYPHAVRGYDFAFAANGSVPGQIGILYIADIEGNQSFAFDLTTAGNDFSLRVEPRYFPMRHFQGRGLEASDCSIYYDFAETWVPLVEQPRPRFQVQAKLVLPQPDPDSKLPDAWTAFDGKQPGCVWHRIFLEACIPPGAEVTVETRAADLQQLLPDTPWRPEPKLYLRGDGPEIPYYKSQLEGPSDRAGTWESLLQSARGRYLQVRLTLTGTGRNSPQLHALRIYYPRFSYLRQYLPPVYRDDAVSASFLDRYLANVEGFYTVLEGKIEQVQAMFDCRIVPAEYLDWLASWMSIGLDTSWSEGTRRLVLSHAPQMFFERGTPNGIVRAVRLMLDACPDASLFDEPSPAADCGCGCGAPASAGFSVRLVERFLTRSAPGIVFGDPTDVAGPSSVPLVSTWTPAQGDQPLHALFRCYLQQQYGAVERLNAAWNTSYSGFDDSTLLLPPVQPVQKVQAQDWQRFLRDDLGFTYAPVTQNDKAAYQAFLAHRYRTISDLNSAYKLVGTDVFSGFNSVPLPASLPSGGARLQDWIAFVSVALPMEQNAHSFTVLVPVTLTDSPDAQQTRLAVAQRVVEIEKPAHTTFDVRLYWGMFRAGEARLGRDTILGSGSRFAALVLGSGYLAGGNLVPTPAGPRDRRRIPGGQMNRQCCELNPQERCI